MTRKRAAIAGLFALVYPGLGHVYLRAWARAALWLGIAIVSAALVVPGSVVTAFESGGLSGFVDSSQELPLTTIAVLFAVRVLNALDAALHAFRIAPPTADGPQCPHCGGELDADLNFCPWCSAQHE